MRLIIFLSVLLLPVAAFAVGDAPPGAFFTCKANEECIVNEALCPGVWIAVNKAHKADYDKYTARRRPLVECPSQDIAKPKNAICKNDVCMLDIYKKDPLVSEELLKSAE